MDQKELVREFSNDSSKQWRKLAKTIAITKKTALTDEKLMMIQIKKSENEKRNNEKKMDQIKKQK